LKAMARNSFIFHNIVSEHVRLGVCEFGSWDCVLMFSVYHLVSEEVSSFKHGSLQSIAQQK
jgi:hypothetical protein